MPPRKNGAGRWESQFTTPPNALGLKRRMYVVCKPAANTRTACLELERQAIERHVHGVGSSSMAFGDFVRDRFLKEYPASKNLSPSWVETLTYLLEQIVIPHLGAVPVGAVEAGTVARMLRKLREETLVDKARAKELGAAARAGRGLAPATIANARDVLERALSWCAGAAVEPDTRFEAAALRFLAARAGELAPSSLALYRYHVHRHLVPYLASVKIGRIDAAKVAELETALASHGRRVAVVVPGALARTGRLKKPWELARDRRRTGRTDDDGRRYSDQTIRHVVIAVKSVLKWALHTSELARLPEIPVPAVAKARRPLPYTREEAGQIIAAAGDDLEFQTFLLLAFDTGARKSEGLGLQLEQLDWQHHRILLDRQMYRGKLRHTKGRRERLVGMSAELEAALKKIRHLRGPFVFCDASGAAWTESYVRTRFERAVERAKLRKIRWHDHRHAFSTNRTDDGVGPFELQQELGHADIKTTQGYVHSSGRRIRSVLDEVG